MRYTNKVIGSWFNHGVRNGRYGKSMDLNGKTVNEVPSINGNDYDSFEEAMLAGMAAAQDGDGIAAVGINLGKLTESFWNDEAREQLGEMETPLSKNPDFWERIAGFIIEAEAVAAEKEIKKDSTIATRISNMRQLLTEGNDWFDKREEEYNAGLKPPMCPVTYNLELYAFDSVIDSIGTIAAGAMQRGDILAAVNGAAIAETLLKIRGTMVDKAPDNVRELPEFQFGEIHSIVSAALPDQFHCAVFENTDHLSRQLEISGERVAKALGIDTNEFPVKRFI